MKIVQILLYTLILFSCMSENNTKPNSLISEDDMVDIISEFMIINAAKGVNKKILEDHIADPSAYVFEKFNIDSLQFEKSNAYYAKHVDVYSTIYARVSQKLEHIKNTTQMRIKEEEKKRDSLKKLKLYNTDTIPRLKKTDFTPSMPRMRTLPKTIDSLAR